MFSLFGRKRRRTPVKVAHITNGPGTFSVEAVGESRYQNALTEICGGRTKDGHRREVEADLIPENDNPHDDHAIRIDIQGKTVGYLDRGTARSFRKALAEIAPHGIIARCRGLIVGGWDRGRDDRGHFGVRLDLPAGSHDEPRK